MDEGTGTSAADISGNGNTGTLTNGPTWVSGQVGSNALQFDGSDDHVAIGNPAVMNFKGQISISAWIKPNSTSGDQSIVAHGPGASDIFLKIDNGNYSAGSYFFRHVDFAIPGTDVGNWVHLVGVYDGEYWRLYRNGVQVAEAVYDTGALESADGWAIGGNITGGNNFDGEIDDVRVYKGVLSEAAIAVLAGTSPALDRVSGRLTKIEDTNGHSTDLTYKTWTTPDIEASPERQWQIDTVTDPHGRVATFTYKSTQVSGRWVIEKIDLPNGEDVDYGYTGGNLTSVDYADGTQSTIAYPIPTVGRLP